MIPEEIAAQIESCVLIPEETDFLTRCALHTCYGMIEIGSLYGRSSIFLGLVAKDKGVPLLCVDTWQNGADNIFPAWEFNIKKAGLEDIITPMRLPSVEAAKLVKRFTCDNFDFLFIDGDHTYEGVKTDYEAWSAILKRPAVVVFHDVQNSSVKKYFNEIIRDNPVVGTVKKNIGRIDL